MVCPELGSLPGLGMVPGTLNTTGEFSGGAKNVRLGLILIIYLYVMFCVLTSEL